MNENATVTAAPAARPAFELPTPTEGAKRVVSDTLGDLALEVWRANESAADIFFKVEGVVRDYYVLRADEDTRIGIYDPEEGFQGEIVIHPDATVRVRVAAEGQDQIELNLTPEQSGAFLEVIQIFGRLDRIRDRFSGPEELTLMGYLLA